MNSWKVIIVVGAVVVSVFRSVCSQKEGEIPLYTKLIVKELRLRLTT